MQQCLQWTGKSYLTYSVDHNDRLTNEYGISIYLISTCIYLETAFDLINRWEILLVVTSFHGVILKISAQDELVRDESRIPLVLYKQGINFVDVLSFNSITLSSIALSFGSMFNSCLKKDQKLAIISLALYNLGLEGARPISLGQTIATVSLALVDFGLRLLRVIDPFEIEPS